MTDRELDVLVAQKVMGWCIHHRNTAHYVLPGMRDYKVEALVSEWRPSTDIAAAWKVVEKLAEEGYWLKLTSPFAPGEPYWAGFTPHNMSGWNGRPDHAASDEKPARAICLAALAAKGIGAGGLE